jgi:ceramide glucosyltransferase
MHILLILFQVGLFFLCLSAIWFYVFSVYGAYDLFRQRSEECPDFRPPVSILKPMRGVDSFAYENLSSFCRQDYPKFQIIFGFSDDKDAGLEIVRRVAADFPAVDIRVVTCPRVIGANLKVSNLANMLEEATHPILLIADSDIRVEPDYLARVIQPLRAARAGVVTCLYRSRVKGFVSSLEALGISTSFHAGVLVARKLQGMGFAFGSTIAIKREVLDRIGGFGAIADYLADDYLLGSLPVEAGYDVILSDYVVEHVVDSESFPEFFRHQTRWGRATRVSRPAGYAGLIFTHGVAASLLFLIATWGSALGWTVLASVWGIRIITGWIVGARYMKDNPVARLFWLIPARDLIGFALWIYTFAGNTVEWRGNRFKLAGGGKLAPIPARRHEDR